MSKALNFKKGPNLGGMTDRKITQKSSQLLSLKGGVNTSSRSRLAEVVNISDPKTFEKPKYMSVAGRLSEMAASPLGYVSPTS